VSKPFEKTFSFKLCWFHQIKSFFERVNFFSVSARSIVCEPSRTRVEIETGPYFGGQISVDGASFPTSAGSTDRFCFVNGNATSRQTSYIFEIDHEKCDGVKVRPLTDMAKLQRFFVFTSSNLMIKKRCLWN
jgi:hypothetical protein